MDFLARVIGDVNNILWSYIIIAMLIGLGLYFSFRVKFVQVRYFGEMIRLLGDGASSKTRKAQKEKSGVSSFHRSNELGQISHEMKNRALTQLTSQ